jgi:hypothetical protein
MTKTTTLLTTLLAPGVLSSQAVVRGVVLTDSTGVPIAGAIVEIAKLSQAVTADAQGLFRFASVPRGKHNMLARAVGYYPRTVPILISGDDSLSLFFRLAPVPVTLTPILVESEAMMVLNPMMGGFIMRRRLGHGEFMGPAELEKLAHTTFPEALRQFGMSIRTNAQGRPYATGRRGGTCPVEVIMDGILQTGLRGQPFDLSSLRVENLAGVEYYVGGATVPVEFMKGNSSCGVLVVWTRQRRP